MSILDFIFSLFSNDLFVEFRKGELEVTNLKIQKSSIYSPIHKKTKIDILSHPRILIGHFQEALELFSEIIIKEHGRQFAANPRIFVQNFIELEGGITEVEKRVIINAFERAGARKVFIVGHPTRLSPKEKQEIYNMKMHLKILVESEA